MALEDYNFRITTTRMSTLINLWGSRHVRRKDVTVTERDYAIDAVHQLNPELSAIFKHMAKSTKLDIPTLESLAPNTLFHVVRTDSFNPATYSFETYDARALNGEDWTGRAISEHPLEAFVESVERAYYTVKTLNKSSLCMVSWKSPGKPRRGYLRALFPLNGGNKILVAVHYKEADVLPDLVEHAPPGDKG